MQAVVGLCEGVEEGVEDGLCDGIVDGVEDGLEEGDEDGLCDGVVDGVEDGGATCLSSQHSISYTCCTPIATSASIIFLSTVPDGQLNVESSPSDLGSFSCPIVMQELSSIESPFPSLQYSASHSLTSQHRWAIV